VVFGIPGLKQFLRLPQQRYRDVTDEFVEFLRSGAGDPEFGWSAMIMGMVGSGKSALAAIVTSILLESDSRRRCAVYQSPSLAAAVQAAAPGGVRERFRAVGSLREIQNHDVVWIDEGALSANAKEALRVELRAFGKALRKVRHKRIVVLLLSQDDGVLLEFRKLAQFWFLKRASPALLELMRSNALVRAHERRLRTLPRTRALLISNYYSFSHTGLLTLPLKRYCPWWGRAVSQNMAAESFDDEFERAARIRAQVREVAQEAVGEFGKTLLKGKASALLRGWLAAERPEVYHDLRKHVSDILDAAVYLLYKGEKRKEEEKVAALRDVVVPPEGIGFGDYVRQFLSENSICFFRRSVSPGDEREVVALVADSVPQRRAAQETGLSATMVSRIWSYYWGKRKTRGGEFAPRELQVWALYERYVAARVGGKRLGGNSEPDVIAPGDVAISCKIYNARDKALTFYVSEDFRPEAGWARARGQDSFQLWVRNIAWGPHDCVLEVRVDGGERVVVHKLLHCGTTDPI